MAQPIDMVALAEVVCAAKRVAKRYRELTGKPLGITGEIGEFHVAELMHATLTEARQPGYDATGSDGRHIQVKTRCVLRRSSPSQRLGRITLDHE